MKIVSTAMPAFLCVMALARSAGRGRLEVFEGSSWVIGGHGVIVIELFEFIFLPFLCDCFVFNFFLLGCGHTVSLRRSGVIWGHLRSKVIRGEMVIVIYLGYKSI